MYTHSLRGYVEHCTSHWPGKILKLQLKHNGTNSEDAFHLLLSEKKWENFPQDRLKGGFYTFLFYECMNLHGLIKGILKCAKNGF